MFTEDFPRAVLQGFIDRLPALVTAALVLGVAAAASASAGRSQGK